MHIILVISNNLLTSGNIADDCLSCKIYDIEIVSYLRVTRELSIKQFLWQERTKLNKG